MVLVALSLLAVGCTSGSSDGGSPDETTTTRPSRPADAIVFGGHGNNLDAHATRPRASGRFAEQRLWETAADDATHGRDLDGQICFLPRSKDGEQWFIAGEDTGRGGRNRPPGWGVFKLEGQRVGHLESVQVGKLVPTYQPSDDDVAAYGCGRLPDGRILTTDVGNQARGYGNGQLTIWFPPLTGGSYPRFAKVAYCKLDVGLATAQSILVRDEDVYVASARGDVYRYRGPFPTSATAKGGCGQKDATGAPLADEVHKDTFIARGTHGIVTPSGLADAPGGGFYVSSVLNGIIDEFGPNGQFRRTILQPPKGESLGKEPFSTGTPLGLGVGPDGTLYYADIGLVVTPTGTGPGAKAGTLRRIRFVAGKPQAPEVMDEHLDAPDGIGVWVPTSGG